MSESAVAEPSAARGWKWWTVAGREWRAAFHAPLAYILLGLWMLVSGVFYVAIITQGQTTDLSGLVQNMLVLILFLAPLLSMRLLAEERKSGTDELILTSPITPAQWVAGKFAGAVLVWTVFVAVALLFPVATSRLGQVQWGVVLASWFGLWLYGSAGLAIGLFASSLSDNQMLAAIVSFAIVLLLYAVSFFGSSASGWLANLLNYMSMPGEFTNFSIGVIGASQVIYFLSVAAGFVFLAVRSVDARRWT